MTFRACPTGCGSSVRAGHLMCAACWRQVPREIQQEVYRTWKKYRTDLSNTDKAQAYDNAANAAIASIP